jgi:hypothetical protein
MTETPQDKGYLGEDAADYGNPADDRDVQTAPAGTVAANAGTEFAPEATTEPGDDGRTYSTI